MRVRRLTSVAYENLAYTWTVCLWGAAPRWQEATRVAVRCEGEFCGGGSAAVSTRRRCLCVLTPFIPLLRLCSHHASFLAVARVCAQTGRRVRGAAAAPAAAVLHGHGVRTRGEARTSVGLAAPIPSRCGVLSRDRHPALTRPLRTLWLRPTRGLNPSQLSLVRLGHASEAAGRFSS